MQDLLNNNESKNNIILIISCGKRFKTFKKTLDKLYKYNPQINNDIKKPTSNKEYVVASIALIPKMQTKIGIVRIDPPAPNNESTRPIINEQIMPKINIYDLEYI